jgi:hypothetical protein
MKNSNSAWQRLVVAARQAPIAGDEAAPYGFSTRVAALAFAAVERPTLQSSLNRFSWRALGVSLMLMIVSIAANYTSVTTVTENDQDVTIDPVEEFLTLS